MIKLLGGVLVILACTLLGLQYAAKKQTAFRAVRELKEVILLLHRHISFCLEPLPELVHRLCREKEDAADSFLKRLQEELEGMEEVSFGCAWAQALTHFAEEKGVPAEALAPVQGLGEGLGSMDSETESARLAFCAEELERLLQEMKPALRQTEKTTKSLGVLSGILIVILFI
ncbi:MAG: hypothetical protein E7414_06220 [Ruminococcaceae bacterium]|nr:hypothetical protein [Oscillospiraceae bacterium]